MLSNKTALITGSTSGIGLGIAHILATEGCNIILNGFGDLKAIEQQQEELTNQFKIQTAYYDADMSKPNEIKDMIHSIEQEHAPIDILVNNAGIQHVDPIEKFPDQKWDDIIAVNLSSAFHTIKAVIPGMKSRNSGRIINIASAHGLVASANKAAYVAAKHGIIGLTKTVALEASEYCITCNAICPGWVLTPLVQQQIEVIAKKEKLTIDEAKLKLLSEKQPSKQFVTVDQIGELVNYLCKENSRLINGSALSIDGGWTAQ